MQYDIWKVCLILSASLAVGWVFGLPLQATLAAAIGIIAWQIIRLRQLLLWIKNPTVNELPDSAGQLYLLHRELSRKARAARARKRQLASLFSQFRHAVSALPDAIILIDQLGHIRWANKNAERIFGVRWPQDANLRLGNLVRNPKLQSALNVQTTHDISPQSKYDTNPAALDGHQAGIEIHSSLDPDTVINVKLIQYTAELKMVLGRDVTRLVKVNRARTDFVANVSHELKTPLTVLRGYLEIMQNNLTLDVALKEPLQQMALQSERMHLLVQDLLFLAKLEDNQPANNRKPVAVPQVINTIVEMTQSELAAKKHQLELDIDQQLKIYGSKSDLQSAFTNLLMNAINYTRSGGVIRISWQANEEQAEFAIKDNGRGVQAHHLPRLTERFYRVDADRSRAGGGTGLGLAIVKHVLQRHGAQLHIESVEGQGSVFTCVFPATRVCRVAQQAPLQL